MTPFWFFVALFTQSLTLRVSPNQGFEPMTVKATVTLARSPNNRGICVGYTTPAGTESFSCRSLDGINELRTMEYRWARLAAGNYAAVAQVELSNGKTLDAITKFTVIGTNE